VAFRPVFSDIQIKVVFRPDFRWSDQHWYSHIPMLSVQTNVRRSGHGYSCVTIYFGIQVNFLFRYSGRFSPYQTDSSFEIASLPILTGIVNYFIGIQDQNPGLLSI
jgi:hypothetical protein